MPGAQVDTHLWVNEYITPWDIYQHGVSNVLACKVTPYQEMQIVESGVFGKALVLDGKWQSCVGDECIYHESIVHPAMIFHGAPAKVLVLGGGEGATIREVLRWKTVKRVVMVDIDGDVVSACMEHLPEMHQHAFDDPRAEVVIGDALAYLDTTKEKWDVVISDLTDPLEEGPSFNFFTKEYFHQTKNVLAPGGYLVLQAGTVAPVNVTMHARIVHTLKTVFPYVHSYSAMTTTYGNPYGFAVGSDSPINTRPNPEEVDQLLQAQTTGGFRLVDGAFFLGMLQAPLYIRKAIAQETFVYTLASPPSYFGKGVMGKDGLDS